MHIAHIPEPAIGRIMLDHILGIYRLPAYSWVKKLRIRTFFSLQPVKPCLYITHVSRIVHSLGAWLLERLHKRLLHDQEATHHHHHYLFVALSDSSGLLLVGKLLGSPISKLKILTPVPFVAEIC